MIRLSPKKVGTRTNSSRRICLILLNRRILFPLLVGFFIGCSLQLIVHQRAEYSYRLFLENKIKTNRVNSGNEVSSWENVDSYTSSDISNNACSKTIDNRNNSSNGGKILCWMMIKEDSLKKNYIHIKETWGRKCDKLVFMSTFESKKHNVVQLNPTKVSYDDWENVKGAWSYIYNNHYCDTDWFVAVKENSFIVIENLRHFLRDYKHNSNIYIGHAMKSSSAVYISTTPAYVLSKAALKLFVTEGVNEKSGIFDECNGSLISSTSATLGYCLNSVGVKAVDTRDSLSRLLFLPNNIEEQILKKYTFTLTDIMKQLEDSNLNSVKEGLNCCSDEAIAFPLKGLLAKNLKKHEYLLYQLNAYGTSRFSLNSEGLN